MYYGISASNASKILYSKIYKTRYFGIQLSGGSTVSGNIISDLNNGNNYSIYVNGGSVFSNNKLQNMHGSIVFGVSDGTVEGNIILADEYSPSAGMFINGSNAVVRYNKIGGFTNNIVVNNSTAIINGNSFIGTMDWSSGKRNIKVVSGSFGIFGGGWGGLSAGATINAQSNYWQNVTAIDIPESIEDYNDDYTYVGTIDYSSAISYHHPSAPISDPANVIKVKSGSDIIFSWNANLESDVAGYKLYYGSPTGYSYSTAVDVGNVTSYTLVGGGFDQEYAITVYDASKDG